MKMQIPLTAKYPHDQGTHLGRGARSVLPAHWEQCLTDDNGETFHHFPPQSSDYSTAYAQWNNPSRNLKSTQVSLSTKSPMVWILSWQTGGHLDMHLLFYRRHSPKTEGSYRRERLHWPMREYTDLSKNIWARLDTGRIFIHGVS